MSNFIQQFKVPISIVIGFVILGLMLRGDSSSPSIPGPNTETSVPTISELSTTTNETEKVPELQPGIPDETTTQLATVTYVVDGDTIEISTGERVRLIGMDTPERGAPYYTEAKNKLSKLVLNKQIRMEKDVSDVDRYSRLLRYLYIGNTFVNLEMVEAGYATTYTYPPDVKYSAQFLAAEQEARNAQLGLWASSITPEPLTVPSSQTGSFTLPPCASSDCDCGHFATRAYAQWFYDNYDPSNRHRLDGDRDGLACESLP